MMHWRLVYELKSGLDVAGWMQAVAMVATVATVAMVLADMLADMLYISLFRNLDLLSLHLGLVSLPKNQLRKAQISRRPTAASLAKAAAESVQNGRKF